MTATHAALERIGFMIAQQHEDVTNDPLPPRMIALLRSSHTQARGGNVLCAFVEALTHPEDFEFVERGGELFLIRRESD